MSAESQIDGYWNPDDPFDTELGRYGEYTNKTYPHTVYPHVALTGEPVGPLGALSIATADYLSHVTFTIPIKFAGWDLSPVSTGIQGSLYSQDIWELDSIDGQQLLYKRLYVVMGMGLTKEEIEVVSYPASSIFGFIGKKITNAYAKIEKWVAERKAEVLKKFPWCPEKGIEPILFVETPGGIYYKTWMPAWPTKYSE